MNEPEVYCSHKVYLQDLKDAIDSGGAMIVAMKPPDRQAALSNGRGASGAMHDVRYDNEDSSR